MRKMKWVFPLMFVIALAGSAFTRQSSHKTSASTIYPYYQDSYGYCVSTAINDDNCTTVVLNYVCYEDIVSDGTGWTVMYQYGYGTVCWQPYYSYYSNYP